MRDARLTGYAKQMRQAPSEPEQRMWLALRGKRFEGVKFRRQKVVGPYIVDFASREPKLAIEIDGDTHAHQAEYDAERSAYLVAQGYDVLRFSNHDVMTNLESVLTIVASRIALPLSQPSPLKGRGL